MAAVPLEGVKVIDFTQMMAGPWGTQMLADLGAEVIKIERTNTGEWERGLASMGELLAGDSPFFHAMNRNKKSLTLDLKHPEAKKDRLQAGRGRGCGRRELPSGGSGSLRIWVRSIVIDQSGDRIPLQQRIREFWTLPRSSRPRPPDTGHLRHGSVHRTWWRSANSSWLQRSGRRHSDAERHERPCSPVS